MGRKGRLITSVIFLLFGLLLGACFGTQWLASALGYSDALGDYVFRVNTTNIYFPWRLFQWGPIVSSMSPKLVNEAYSFLLGGAVFGLTGIVGVTAMANRKGSNKTIFGDSSFANTAEIEQMGLVGTGEGIFLGKLNDGRFIRHEGESHYAVIAPTRRGKGECVVVPTLLSFSESAIVHDLKQENFRKTAGIRRRFSDVYCVDPTSSFSARFNPLLELRPGDLETRDAQNLANMIIEPEIVGRPDHWVRTGNAVLTAVILHVLYTAPRELKNLAGITAFLSQAELSIRDTLHQMLETKHLLDPTTEKPTWVHPGVAAAARDVLNKSPDDLSSVLSTVMGYLSVFRDPLLANVTRDSDFRILDLVCGERPKTVYLVVPTSDIDRLRPFLRIVVNQVLRRLTEPPSLDPDIGKRRRVLLMLDEFPALGRLEFLESALGFIAGFGLKAVLIAQSLPQIRQVYGPNTSILDNADVQLFMTPSTLDTAKYISDLLGETTVSFRTEAASGQRGNPFYTGKSESEHVARRPLMTPREVLSLPLSEEILFVGGGKPIRCEKIVQYKDEAFKELRVEAPKLEELRKELDRKPKLQSPWFQNEFRKRPPARFDDWKWPIGGSDSARKGASLSGRVVLVGKGDEQASYEAQLSPDSKDVKPADKEDIIA